MKRNELVSDAPFIRLVIALIIGIVFSSCCTVEGNILTLMLGITFLAAVMFAVLPVFASNYTRRWVGGMCLQLTVVFLGMLLNYLCVQQQQAPCRIPENYTTWVGVITEPVEEKTRAVQCFLDIKHAEDTLPPMKTIAYIAKTAASKQLMAGDMLVFSGKVSRVAFSGNLFEFDYRAYLAEKGVYSATYIDSLHWQLLAHGQLPFLKKVTYGLRHRLLNLFETLGVEGDELGVLMALTIGDRANLDSDIKQAYASSGTMHLLAVSGMHVALVYWVLNLLIGYPSRKKRVAVLQACVLLVLLWFYAMVTGLPASIQRAAVMCTFIIVSELGNRQSNLYNSLAAAAFFLLLFHPMYLFDAGFQLSFLAVLSIVVFYKPIYSLIEPATWLGSQVWAILAVSLAAQILTFPISVYYFHQFPLLFLISNLVMIPISTLVIYLAMVLISLSWWPWITVWMGKVLVGMVWVLNHFVQAIEKIPHSTISGIYVSQFEVMLMYIFILLVAMYLFKRYRWLIVGMLSVITLWLGMQVADEYTGLKRTQVVICNIRSHTAIQFVRGREAVWLVSKYDAYTANVMRRNNEGLGITKSLWYPVGSLSKVTQNKGVSLTPHLWMNGNVVLFEGTTFSIHPLDGCQECSIAADYQIVTWNGSENIPFTSIHQLGGKVIFDSSVPSFALSVLKKELPPKYPWVSVVESGAQIIPVR